MGLGSIQRVLAVTAAIGAVIVLATTAHAQAARTERAVQWMAGVRTIDVFIKLSPDARSVLAGLSIKASVERQLVLAGFGTTDPSGTLQVSVLGQRQPAFNALIYFVEVAFLRKGVVLRRQGTPASVVVDAGSWRKGVFGSAIKNPTQTIATAIESGVNNFIAEHARINAAQTAQTVPVDARPASDPRESLVGVRDVRLDFRVAPLLRDVLSERPVAASLTKQLQAAGLATSMAGAASPSNAIDQLSVTVEAIDWGTFWIWEVHLQFIRGVVGVQQPGEHPSPAPRPSTACA